MTCASSYPAIFMVSPPLALLNDANLHHLSFSSLSSGSFSCTTTYTLYTNLKKSLLAKAREGHTTEDKSPPNRHCCVFLANLEVCEWKKEGRLGFWFERKKRKGKKKGPKRRSFIKLRIGAVSSRIWVVPNFFLKKKNNWYIPRYT